MFPSGCFALGSSAGSYSKSYLNKTLHSIRIGINVNSLKSLKEKQSVMNNVS